mmetsp:Transcript_3591/g.6147  ORF Transcript_3591/g.6147 Transcript_3591/m.6147 type:complete len:400 (-) Transcript_3591:477-1676(-)
MGFCGTWILRWHTALDALGKAMEIVVQSAFGGCVNYHLDRQSLPDFGYSSKNVWVVVHLIQRRNGHHLGDGAEAEDLRVPQLLHVGQAVRRVPQRVGHQLVEAAEGVPAVLRQRELPQQPRGFGVLAPHLPGPPGAAVHIVLQEVADDVRLLQEEAHAVGQCGLRGHLRGLLARGGEQPREALADEAGDVVAVEVVVPERGGALAQVRGGELAHAPAHALADVRDHPARVRVQRLVDAGHAGKVVQQVALVALPYVRHAHPPPLVHQPRLVELLQVPHLLLHVLEGQHVVLDGVQRAQRQVEHQDAHGHLPGQLQDDRRERARDLGQHALAVLLVLVGRGQVAAHAARGLEPEGGSNLVQPQQLPELPLLVHADLAVAALLLLRVRGRGPGGVLHPGDA